jgi:HTH-type transcriptional regulator/antitoxin HigA
MTRKYPYRPDYAVPPGATLKETLETKGMSQADLALRTGMAEKTISQIINGIAPLSYETAEKLELVLGIPARFWNTREVRYREVMMRIEETEGHAKDVEWLKELPLKVLIDRKWIPDATDERTLVRSVLRFFGVSSVDAWRNTWGTPCVKYRGGEARYKHPGHVASWLRMGEIAAEAVKCEPYNPVGFRAVLKTIRSLSTQPVATWKKTIQELCASVGIAVVFIPEIPGAGVSGVAKWLTKDKALIQVSLKYKSDDQLWFSFFHEAFHILLHGKKDLFIEDGRRDSEDEREADRYAQDFLIPPERRYELSFLKTKVAICAFAHSLGIAPGIVVGRLHHDHLLAPAFCNDLKMRIDWGKPTKDNE